MKNVDFRKKIYTGFWINLHRYKKDQIKLRILELFESGIDEILVSADLENLRYAADICSSIGMKLHSWQMMMINNDRNIVNDHSNWFALSRSGQNSAQQPPYVGYYKWLCPNNPEAESFLINRITNLCKINGISAIHLDYIRFSDVILPVKCQKQYDITQKEEMPQYDFCYCDHCRSKFKKMFGYDILTSDIPQNDENWKKFRYDTISKLVEKFADIAHENGKEISAAVFPTPAIARNLVRQDWPNWKLDHIYPMLYHEFYEKNTNWIFEALNEDRKSISCPVHAGIFLPSFNENELNSFLTKFFESGFKHICFFDHNSADSKQINVIRSFTNKK